MSTFAASYVSRVLFASPAPGSSARRLGDGAGSRPRCWIRIGRSCTTCVAPVQNGERSMRTAQGAQARSRSSPIISESIAELMRRATPMAFTQYAANMARAFMVVELAMASVNCGAPIATRAQAEKLLDEYFALVEQAVPLTEENPLDRC